MIFVLQFFVNGELLTEIFSYCSVLMILSLWHLWLPV